MEIESLSCTKAKKGPRGDIEGNEEKNAKEDNVREESSRKYRRE